MQDLLELPLQLQATLASGYLGYILFKRDYRNTEKTSDIWMLILFFGLPTALIIQKYDSDWAYISVLLGPAIAFLWLKFFQAGWTSFLYRNRVSHNLNTGDVWKTMSSYKGVAATQIKLIHKNGNQYLCNSTMTFVDEAFVPFIMDEDGIAFYVTDVKGKDDLEWVVVTDVQLDPEFGSMITYFPRSDIELLEMRYTKQVK